MSKEAAPASRAKDATKPVLLWSAPKDDLGDGSIPDAGDPFINGQFSASSCVIDLATGRAALGGAGCTLVSDSDAAIGPLMEDPQEAITSGPFYDAGERPTCYKSAITPGFVGACPTKLGIDDLPLGCEE